MSPENKYKTLRDVVVYCGNKKRAAINLNCTERNINYLAKQFDENDPNCFVHGNTGKWPHNKTDEEIVKKILYLQKTKYKHFNAKHLHEKLVKVEKIQIKYSTLKNILKKHRVKLKTTRKITLKIWAKEIEEMNKIKNRPINQTIEEYINLVHVKSDKHCRIVNEPKFGYIVEADASVYEFFGGIKTYLHLFVDRYTGKILAGHLDHQETLAGYQQAFYQLVKKYGIPMKLVTDKRTIFVYKRVSSNSETAKLTQFGYWAEKLGMDLYTTSTSQEKPMVERANRTLQDRITALFSLYKNMTIEKANELLPSLIKETNCSLNYSEKGLENVFEKYNEDRFGPLEIMLSIRETRMMANGFIFSLNGMKCEAHDPKTGKLMHFLPKTPILILTTAKREKILSICNGFYDIVEYKKDGRRAISHIGFPIKRDHPWMQCKDFIRYKVDYPVRTNSIYESPIKTNCYNS